MSVENLLRGSSDCSQTVLKGLDLMAEGWWLMYDVWWLTGEGREGFGERSKLWAGCFSFSCFSLFYGVLSLNYFFFLYYIYLIINNIYNIIYNKNRNGYPSKINWNNWNWNRLWHVIFFKKQKHSKIRCPVKSTVSRFYPQKQDN